MTKIPPPTFVEEKKCWSSGYSTIAGLDEVGRGAFAGPVVTAAVIFPKDCSFINPLLSEIHDSKLVNPEKRKQLAEVIKQEALCYSIAESSVAYINSHGVGKATQKAFRKALSLLCHKADFVLVDAFYIPSIPKRIQKPIIHGDRLSISIAAASILAKVYRDQLMETFGEKYSYYGFAENKGYGTAFHREQIRIYGLSPLHRTSFSLEKFVSS